MPNLLYVEDVMTYFRELVDAPDQGFMTDLIAQQWLQIGFDHYYNFMTLADPERFIKSYAATLTNVFELDLDGALLGSAAPAAQRMLQLVRVVRLDVSTGRPNQYMYPVASREQLDSCASEYDMVLLSARKLYFNVAQNGSYSVDYIPMSTVNWALSATGNNEFIDDLIPFHDIIALYSALQYYASAGFENPQVDKLLVVRQQAFKSQLQRGRNVNAARYVQDETPYNW